MLRKCSDSYEAMDILDREGITYVQDLQKTSLPDASFDSIFCSQVLHHLPEPERALAEMHRILRPGGKLLLSVPHLSWLHNEPHDYYRFTRQGIAHLLEKTGLRAESIEPAGGLLCFQGYILSAMLLGLTWRVPLLCRLAFWLNLAQVRVVLFLDRLLGFPTLFPTNYIVVASKEGESARPARQLGQRTNILYVIDNLRHGGAQKALLYLVRALDRTKAQPIIWCLGGTSRFEQHFRDEGVEVIRFSKPSMCTGIPLLQMLRRMRRERVHIVHTFLFHSDNLGRTLAHLAKVPVIISSVRATNIRKRYWMLALDRSTAPLADAVVAVSHRTLEYAIVHEGVSSDRSLVIPNGIDTSSLDYTISGERVRRELGIAPDQPVVGTTGRLHEQKGHRFLLEAAATILKQMPRTVFLIAGFGPLREKLERMAESLGVAEQVKFLGYRTDVPELLAAMDLFVLSSLYEGMSNALLEAMAMAKPCVASDVDGNVELVVDGVTGILVPASNSAALAAASLKLLKSPEEARAMGLRGRERVEKEFSLDRTIKEHGRLYRALLEQKHSGCRSLWLFQAQKRIYHDDTTGTTP